MANKLMAGNAYPGSIVDSEIDKGAFSEGLEDLAIGDIETGTVGQLLWERVCLLRGSGSGALSRERRLIVATAIGDFTATATITGPLAIALWKG